ncbi:hypothetical protein BD770DRAFT_385411 [Pilaira anomala]|nr:hypothetical protein BD770DRAFT_385411 [Pilaira anomala]
MPKFDELPHEIISLFCSLLKQSAKYNCIFVSREFHAAAIPELWREPVLSSTHVVKQLLKCLKLSKHHQRGEYIRVIKLGYKVSISDNDLLSLMPYLPNLEVLEIRKADELTDKSVMRVSQYCTQLKSFGIKGALVTYRSAHYLGQCQQLTKLSLESCLDLSALSLLPFAELHIEYLDLSGCKWLNIEETAYDLCSFEHLINLNLVCCDTISTDFINYLTSNDRYQGKACLTKLQDFSITGGTVIEDSSIIPFIKTHPNIRGLFLLECAITDRTLDVIAKYLPYLHNLDVSFCGNLTPVGVRNLICKCPNLKLLGLKNCGITQTDFSEIPSTVFPAITENYPHINTLSNIELGYIRARSHDQQEQADSVIDDITMDEVSTTSRIEDDSVSESYTYIQQYLDGA